MMALIRRQTKHKFTALHLNDRLIQNKYTLNEGVFVCWMYFDCRRSKLVVKRLIRGRLTSAH